MIIRPLHTEGSEENCSFHGSKGWSENFKNRISLKRSENHRLLIRWLVIKFPERFKKVIEEKGYLPRKSVATAFKMSGTCCGQSIVQVKCPLWTFHSDKKGAHLVGYYHVHPLKVNLDEMGLKIKDKLEAVMAPYKEVYKDIQKKAKIPKNASSQSIDSAPAPCILSFDHHGNFQP